MIDVSDHITEKMSVNQNNITISCIYIKHVRQLSLFNCFGNSCFFFLQKFFCVCVLLSLSWAGVRHHTSGVVFLVRHVMPSSGGAVGARWYVPFRDESSDLNSSMSGGSSGACVALQPAGSLASSRKESSLWGDSTKCLPRSG